MYMNNNFQYKQVKSVREILLTSPPNTPSNVNNVNKNISNNVRELNVNVSDDDKNEKINYNAHELAICLNDFKSLNYYKKLFREHNEASVYECLSITKDARNRGKIRTTPAQYFVGVVRNRFGKQ